MDHDFSLRLHKAIAAVCPIIGIGIGVIEDRSTWKVTFADNATQEQKDASQAVINAFDTTTQPELLSPFVMIGRMTVEEYTDIRRAAAVQLAAGNGQLEMWIDMARTAPGGINLNDPATIAAKAALVGSGLLSKARADAILAPP